MNVTTSIINEHGNQLKFTSIPRRYTSGNTEYWKEYDKNGNLIYERFSNDVVRTHLYDAQGKFILTYDPSEMGAIVAIRLFYDEYRSVMAELAFAYGSTHTTEWTDIAQRRAFQIGINGYTFIFDERDVAKEKTFQDFVKTKEN